MDSDGKSKAYDAWTPAEAAFANNVVQAYFETFMARQKVGKHISDQRLPMTRADQESEFYFLASEADTFYQLMTSTVSHNMQRYMVEQGIDGRTYPPEQANRFLGVVARAAIDIVLTASGRPMWRCTPWPVAAPCLSG